MSILWVFKRDYGPTLTYLTYYQCGVTASRKLSSSHCHRYSPNGKDEQRNNGNNLWCRFNFSFYTFIQLQLMKFHGPFHSSASFKYVLQGWSTQSYITL